MGSDIDGACGQLRKSYMEKITIRSNEKLMIAMLNNSTRTEARSDMRVYSATNIGMKRKMNQDYVFASQDTVGNLPNLFAVADGMGGHNAGDYASSHAVRILVDEIREDTDYNPVKVIRHAIETANTEIIEQAQKDEKLRGMGTTMVVATIVGQYAYVAMWETADYMWWINS